MEEGKNIIFAVLNWGLGHATRSIPIINHLLEKGYNPILASSGESKMLLKKEFPELICLSLPDYGVKYYFQDMAVNLLLQGPKVCLSIIREHWRMNRLVKDYNAVLVISDNRFGCWDKKVPSVFITHQVHLQTSRKWMSKPANWINHYFIKKFDHCRIIDIENRLLAGTLSKSLEGVCCKYTGVVSRLESFKTIKKTYDLIVIISGPEPQRTLFEKKVIKQLKNLPYKSLVVGGKPELHTIKRVDGQIEIQNFMDSVELNKAISSADFVLCRSGYSSILDLAALSRSALLVPTPGQTEQEYLADRFSRLGLFYSVSQNDMDLRKDLKEAIKYPGFKEIKSKMDLSNFLEGIPIKKSTDYVQSVP